MNLVPIDVMKDSYRPTPTIGVGAVMSAGLLIFASGKQGERYIGKNTGIYESPTQ